ncbi:hypothetical protein E8E12_000272 [Didymella heteroderae]|uniref:Uncharacterized protein n=1 Tax=Didymella heteroderae TaxID=1769908 RepID=A0A9P4WFJ8_9PLEO|nr:hypothetical protein E8E12_000272 [Didymella heteroderae]
MASGPMLQDILRKSHGADNVSDHSEDTVTAEFLEKVGAVPYADTEDAPSVELTGDLVKKAESASADDVSPPVPTESEPEIVDIDDQSILAPELLKPPPIDSKDCYPLPQATFVPSYILAGSNRFTADEVRSIDPTIQFVRLREIDAPKCRAWLCGLLSQGCLLTDAPKTFVPVSSRLVKSKLIDQACS